MNPIEFKVKIKLRVSVYKSRSAIHDHFNPDIHDLTYITVNLILLICHVIQSKKKRALFYLL